MGGCIMAVSGDGCPCIFQFIFLFESLVHHVWKKNAE